MLTKQLKKIYNLQTSVINVCDLWTVLGLTEKNTFLFKNNGYDACDSFLEMFLSKKGKLSFYFFGEENKYKV
jgi:hypothetical protein